MATTGELQAIIQELQLIDIGDAASYLGEEATLEEEESTVSVQPAYVLVSSASHLATCDCASCQDLHAQTFAPRRASMIG
jgi:hypothetical protein